MSNVTLNDIDKDLQEETSGPLPIFHRTFVTGSKLSWG